MRQMEAIEKKVPNVIVLINAIPKSWRGRNPLWQVEKWNIKKDSDILPISPRIGTFEVTTVSDTGDFTSYVLFFSKKAAPHTFPAVDEVAGKIGVYQEELDKAKALRDAENEPPVNMAEKFKHNSEKTKPGKKKPGFLDKVRVQSAERVKRDREQGPTAADLEKYGDNNSNGRPQSANLFGRKPSNNTFDLAEFLARQKAAEEKRLATIEKFKNDADEYASTISQFKMNPASELINDRVEAEKPEKDRLAAEAAERAAENARLAEEARLLKNKEM